MTVLRTARDVAVARAERLLPPEPVMMLLSAGLRECAEVHRGRYPLVTDVSRATVQRMYVRLYPGFSRLTVLMPGDGWIRPDEVLAAAGGDSARPFCIHRDANTGDYLVFQRKRAGATSA